MKTIKVREEDWIELSHLKLELKHKALTETISYLLYELNKGEEK